MAFNFNRIWRGKYPLLISVITNIILFTFIIKLISKSNDEANNREVAKRSTDSNPIFHMQNMAVRNKRKNHLDCFIFILILTAPAAEERRQAVRQTWLRMNVPGKFSVNHRFAVGTVSLDDQQKIKLKVENHKHKDILFLNGVHDSYQNLTSKLLHSFKWIAKNINTKFVLKVDDDSFVRLGILAQDLEAKEKYGRIYWGFFRGDANVKTRGPWAEPNWVLCDKYLPYANGGGYILSQDLVHYISQQSNFLQLYNSEDVSVGTWLAPVLLNRVHDVRFDTEYKTRGCSNKHIVSHKQSTRDMFSKYKELVRNNRLCSVERTERLSFEYDWKAKPSKCCKRVQGIP